MGRWSVAASTLMCGEQEGSLTARGLEDVIRRAADRPTGHVRSNLRRSEERAPRLPQSIGVDLLGDAHGRSLPRPSAVSSRIA